MAGNPKKSKWYSTKVRDRNFKPVQVLLSEEARGKLERLSKGTSKSATVEKLILEAKE